MEKKAGNTKCEGQSEQFVNSSEVAKLIGKSSRTVQQLTSDGILPTTEVRNGKRTLRKYDKYKTVQAYIEYISRKTEEKYGEEKKREKIRIETETKEIKMKMLKLQLGEMEGTLHSSEDVASMTDSLVLCVRSNLLAIPGQLAAEITGLSDAAEVSAKIEEAVYKVLDELANYEYDPEEYRRKVRERNGRKENHMED